MKKLLFLCILAPSLASAQVQVQASAGFTLDLPVIIPQLVVVTPGIQVVPDVDYEVFHADGFYWTRHEGRWYRSSNPRSGWAYMSRGVPPGLSRMPPGKYKRWRPQARPAAGPVFRGAPVGPGPAFRGDRRDDRRDERHDGRHDGRGRDHDDHDRGGKHGGKHGRGHD
jgi:hypothetical protein